jgi:beta-catenin-like protein 1
MYDEEEDEIEQEQQLTEDMINKLLEEAEQHDNRMTKDSLIICLNNLEHHYNKNKELRKKYNNKPELYADSEADLHEEIKVLQRIAAYPDLITILIENKGIELLITLLEHENNDITADAVIVIDEITDGDFLQELEFPKEFLELFISNNIFELLTNIIQKLNEKNKDELQLISDILSVFENFLDVYPFTSQLICEKTHLLEWLIKRISKKENLNIRLFASEIIDSLILSSSDNQIIFNKKDGLNVSMNVLLDFEVPQNEVEEEFIFNIMNIICNTLLMTENQESFREAYGIKHMINLMRENNIYRHIAVKILNYALLNNEDNCSELIQQDGLKSIFSYFMGKGLKGKKNKKLIDTFEQHILSLIVSLCKYSKNVNHDRLIYKFKEMNYEKCERIVEFYKIYESNTYNEESLFILQYISIIIAFISQYTDIKQKFLKIFPINNISFENIKLLLYQMRNNLGEDFESTETFSNKKFIDNILRSIN